MSYNAEKHIRRSIRLPHYDYRGPGAYFITICTYNRELLFLDPRYRAIAEEQWALSSQIRQEIDLDAFVVMPNHVHGIVWIVSEGTQGLAPLPPPRSSAPQVVPRSLGAFVRGYKSAVTREINNVRDTRGQLIWQRNYYEHILRKEADLHRIREYILENPQRWAFDRENPVGNPDDQETDFWAFLTDKRIQR